MVIKVNISRSSPIIGHEIRISLRTLVLGVPRQHTLQAHADTLNILHGRPALLPQKIQTDDAVGVDVRVHRDGPVRGGHEGYFGWFWWGGCSLELVP